MKAEKTCSTECWTRSTKASANLENDSVDLIVLGVGFTQRVNLVRPDVLVTIMTLNQRTNQISDAFSGE